MSHCAFSHLMMSVRVSRARSVGHASSKSLRSAAPTFLVPNNFSGTLLYQSVTILTQTVNYRMMVQVPSNQGDTINHPLFAISRKSEIKNPIKTPVSVIRIFWGCWGEMRVDAMMVGQIETAKPIQNCFTTVDIQTRHKHESHTQDTGIPGAQHFLDES